MTVETERKKEGVQVKQLGVCAHDKWPLLLPSCLAAPGWKKRRSGRKREEMEKRIEGHTRQWGLCGHLSVTDGKAVGSERTERGQKGVQIPECACVWNEKGMGRKTGNDENTGERKSVKWGKRSYRSSTELIKHPVSLYQPECTLKRV